MNRYKLFVLLGLLVLSSTFLVAQPEYSYHHKFFPIEEVFVLEESNETQVTIGYGIVQGLMEDSLAQVMGLWDSENPDQNTVLGKAKVIDMGETETILELPSPSTGIQEGDLVEMVIALEDIKYEGLLFSCVLNNIGITDVFEEPLLVESDLLWSNKSFDEEVALGSMLEDVKFVAQEMRSQMEDYEVSSGSFAGQTILDAMEGSSLQDLRNFFKYVHVRPEKYRGRSWKIAEIYATWIDAGAPTPESKLDLLIAEIQEEINNQQGTQQLAEDEQVDLYLNLKKGTLNKTKPTASFEEVKEDFPFFTGETEEGVDYNCGGGVFFLKHDFYFYTHRNYIEVRAGFEGTCSMDLLGKSEEELIEMLGEPDLIPKNPYEGENDRYIYKMKYGSLVVRLNSMDQVYALGVHNSAPKDVVICW